ncbi:MAG: type II toxin-antitoxin system HicB family antitoxin [bacterium]|nr:type II toxin-antitoxin system HicB family antitoxin [bacterium]
MKHYTFRVIIEPDENNTFHGFVPSLPGCHTCGDTLQETKENLKDAIKCFVASLLADKLPVPQENGFTYTEAFAETEFKIPARLSHA